MGEGASDGGGAKVIADELDEPRRKEEAEAEEGMDMDGQSAERCCCEYAASEERDDTDDDACVENDAALLLLLVSVIGAVRLNTPSEDTPEASSRPFPL